MNKLATSAMIGAEALNATGSTSEMPSFEVQCINTDCGVKNQACLSTRRGKVLFVKVLLLSTIFAPSFTQGGNVIDLYIMPVPQLSFIDSNTHQVRGSLVEMVDGIFKRAGISARFHLVPWMRAVETARKVNNACVIGYRMTSENRNQFKWIGPILKNQTYVYTRLNNVEPVTSLGEMRGLRVGIGRGAALGEQLRKLGIQLEEATTGESNVTKLQAERFDYIFLSDIELTLLISENERGTLKKLFSVGGTDGHLACNLGMSDGDITNLSSALLAQRKAGYLAPFGLPR